MKKSQEKLLVAALAGLVIAGVGAFAVQPAMAAGYHVDAQAQVTGVQWYDTLNVRKWPASYSQKIGEFEPYTHVWIERCIVSPEGGADWCLVERGEQRGWVSSRYLTLTYDNDI